jgi:CRISP-associated protein Cas1
MGLEGQAGAIYWQQLVGLAPEKLEFKGRKTRGAEDPVNQCLNYLYALLYGEVWQAVARVGLDPYFGLIHGSQRDEGSLVFDLIEEFRASFVDRLVFGMMGRGFIPEIDHNRILKTAKRKQLTRGFRKSWSKKVAWHSQRIAPAEILDQQVQSLKKVFLQRDAYHPYRMRW